MSVRIVMDRAKHFTVHGTDVNFTPEGMDILRSYGVQPGDASPPIKMTAAGQTMLVVEIYSWNTDPAAADAVAIVKHKTILDAAKCYGYYGFGTGFMKGKMDLAIVGKDWPMALFCPDSCPVATECCTQHRLRCDQLGLDSNDASVENAIDGEHAARGERMRNRGEATLTWPLKIIQSVIRAN